MGVTCFVTSFKPWALGNLVSFGAGPTFDTDPMVVFDRNMVIRLFASVVNSCERSLIHAIDS